MIASEYQMSKDCNVLWAHIGETVPAHDLGRSVGAAVLECLPEGCLHVSLKACAVRIERGALGQLDHMNLHRVQLALESLDVPVFIRILPQPHSHAKGVEVSTEVGQHPHPLGLLWPLTCIPNRQ